MTGEKSTLALNVDLDCHSCYKKMRKALCKFPEIESQNFDEEQKKVIISGPFEPEKLIKKLRCKVGCKIIKGHVIIPKERTPDPPPVPKNEREPKLDKKPLPKPVPVVPGPVNIVIGPIGPVCSHRPFELVDYSILVDCNCKLRNPTCHCNGSRGNCQCGCGGHFHSHGSQGNCQYGGRGHFPPHGSQGNCQCGCGGQSGCHFLIEEENGCTIM